LQDSQTIPAVIISAWQMIESRRFVVIARILNRVEGSDIHTLRRSSGG
jgi:hypothetical protein